MAPSNEKTLAQRTHEWLTRAAHLVGCRRGEKWNPSSRRIEPHGPCTCGLDQLIAEQRELIHKEKGMTP